MRETRLSILLMMSFLGTLLVSGGCSSHNTESKDVVKSTYIHKYGITVSQDDWDKRGRDGTVINVLKSGITKSESYTSGVLDGPTTYTFPHSRTVHIEEGYQRGSLVRKLTNYVTGNPKEETEFLSATLKQKKTWYENGTPKSTETWDEDILTTGKYFTPENELEAGVEKHNGIKVERDAYGQFISKDEIIDGQIALKTTFHPNGNPKEIIVYHENVVHGLKRVFTPSGEPQQTEEWVNGKQHGITTIYQNGEKTAELSYVNGMKHGVELQFQEGNIVVREINWRAGVRHGPSRSYFSDQVRTDWFHSDKLVSKLEFDQLNNLR